MLAGGPRSPSRTPAPTARAPAPARARDGDEHARGDDRHQPRAGRGDRPGPRARAHRQARPRTRRGARPADPAREGGQSSWWRRWRARPIPGWSASASRSRARSRATSCSRGAPSGSRISHGASRPRSRSASTRETGALMPLVYRGRALGVLCAYDRADGPGVHAPTTSACSQGFAASAAVAVATAQRFAEQGLRRSIEAAEQERTRWARELHDETLQELGGPACPAAPARGARTPTTARGRHRRRRRADRASRSPSLRHLITELRPAALDELGLGAGDRGARRARRPASGLDVAVDVALGATVATGRLEAEAESTLYRLVQEALTNIVRHADAENVHIVVARTATTSCRGPRRRARLRPRRAPRGLRPGGHARARRAGRRDAADPLGAGGGDDRLGAASRGRRRSAPAARSARGSLTQVVAARRRRARPAWSSSSCAGCGCGGSRPCAPTGRACPRSPRSCARARSARGSRPRAASARRAGPRSGGAAARRAPSRGFR